MKLLVGNKNYSSWSMRPWLVLKHFGIPFSDEVLSLAREGWKDVLTARTPAGLVPVLEHDGLAIGETLAIIEYLNDLYPQLGIWPKDVKQRAMARALASEMHAGFSALRAAAPMNIRASMPGRVSVEQVQKDLDRLNEVLGNALTESGGPYLFGEFSAADAMFAPVAMRIMTYQLPVSDQVTRWVDAIRTNSAVQAWTAEARAETEIVPADELDVVTNP